METLTYALQGLVPQSARGVEFLRIEVMKYESSPLALVWYRLREESTERGARIDLQKQVFLDDFGTIDRGALDAEAHLIVHFVHELSKHQRGTAVSMFAD